MRTPVIASVMALGLLGLAACSNDKADPKMKVDGEAAAPAAGAEAGSLEGPKPGKWRIATQLEGVPGGATVPPTEVCVTEAVLEAPSAANTPAGADCTVTPYTREGNAMVASSACTIQGIKTTSNVRVTGDFSSRYVTEVTTTMDPAPAPGMGNTKMTLTAERIGDC